MVPASVRCTPSTRMSRTVNGSNAKAPAACMAAHSAISSARTTRSRGGAMACMVLERLVRCGLRPSEQAGDVIEQGKGHEHCEHGHADALTDFERAIGYRAALENFGEIIQQMPTVQERHRQQVEHAEADADERE